MQRYTKPADGRWHGKVLRREDLKIGGRYRLSELPFGIQFKMKGRKTIYSTMTYAWVGAKRYGHCPRDCWNEVEGQAERIDGVIVVSIVNIN